MVTDVSVTASVVAGVAPSADTVRVEASAVKVGPASSGDEDSSDSDEEAWRREGLVKHLERKIWPIACAVMPYVNSDPAVAARSALIPPPRMLRGNLAPHQRVGLTWPQSRETCLALCGALETEKLLRNNPEKTARHSSRCELRYG